VAVSSPIEAPQPNPPKPKPNALRLNAPEPQPVASSRFALGHTSLALGTLQASAELFDGIATHRFVHAATCRSCVEVDPVCRLFLGPKPTWPRMLSLGTMEAFGAAYVHQGMHRSPHKLVRWLAPVAPLTLIGIHLEQGLGVFSASTNPCAPLGSRYTVVSQSPAGDQVTCNQPAPPLMTATHPAPPARFRLK
jgi:hypothetical protein